MVKVKANTSISFLIEFMIVLTFFCVAAIICVSIYSNSYRMNKEANHGKQALVYAQNYVESLEEQDMKKETFYLNEEFEESTKEKRYEVKIEKQEKEKYKISIFEKEKELISLPFLLEEGRDTHE